jgi:polyvinyl alcohol dehydrogenase (cytochrome)
MVSDMTAARVRLANLVRLVASGLSMTTCLVGCKSSTPPTATEADATSPPLDCAAAADGGDWPMYGQNICNTHASPSTAITAQNVGRLAVQWKLTTPGDISATPAVVGGKVYFPDWSGLFFRVDAASGHVDWSRSVSDILGLSTDGGAVDGATAEGGDDAGAGDDASNGDVGGGLSGTRSSAVPVSRGTPVVTGNLVIFGVATPPATLVAVDRDTGALVWKTVVDSNPWALVAASPALYDGVLYVGISSAEEFASYSDPSHTFTFRGSVVAVDPTNGRLIWRTPTIDDDVYYNPDGTPSGFSGAAVWSSSPTIDVKRKQVYVTSGNNYAVPASFPDGGTLPSGDRLESIIALDLATGKVRWSQRMTTGDTWNFTLFSNPDFDFGCGANLFQATIAGTTHDVVGAGQKSGVYWALDADTGSVLWHTQVGPGGHLGGIHWGTAVDGQRIYVGVNDENGVGYTLGGPQPEAGAGDAGPTKVGSWAALDPATGRILWQIANPAMSAPVAGASVNGPVTVVNGVVLVGSMDNDGTMFGFEASTGKQLWSFKSGATVYGGPAIADGMIFWGNGYPSRLLFGTPGNTLYAFAPPAGP